MKAIILFLPFLLLGSAFSQSPPSTRERQVKPPVTQPARDEDETVRVETNLTNVLFTAIDRDKRFVTTLTSQDIRLFEDDVLQSILSFQRETELPLSIALVLDTSLSQEFTLPDEKAAAQSFVQNIIRPAGDSAVIVSFNGRTQTHSDLTSDQLTLSRALEVVSISRPPQEYHNNTLPDPGCRVDPRGCSSIWDAVVETASHILAATPANTRRAIILLTDGSDSSSQNSRDEAAELAVKANVVVYAIGIGDRENYKVEESSLRKLAERTGGRAFFPRPNISLRDIFTQLEQELRTQYLITYTPSNPAQNLAFRRIRIDLMNPAMRKNKLKLYYRNGYFTRSNR